VIKAWRRWLWLMPVLACSLGPARAQMGAVEVIVAQDTVSFVVFEILHGALSRDGIGLRRSADTAACSGKLEPSAEVRARVWLQWKKHVVTLCFQDRCGSSERSLGPFADLDARAREEMITVIESGLDALPFRCPNVEAQENPTAAATIEAEAVTTLNPETSQPAARSPQAEPQARRKTSESAPANHGATPSAAETSTSSELPNVVHALAPADGSQNSLAAPVEGTLLLAARYGITRFSNKVVGQYFGGAIAYSVHSQPFFVGLEVDYAPPFRVMQEELAIDASSLRIGLQFWVRWALAQRAVLDLQLGTALDWLSLVPALSGDRMLQDRRTMDHLDPYLFVRAGPALRISQALFVGIGLQLDASFLARSYGFVVGTAQREVFAPDRVRISVALHVRAEL
jgi:hypothetical protein